MIVINSLYSLWFFPAGVLAVLLLGSFQSVEAVPPQSAPVAIPFAAIPTPELARTFEAPLKPPQEYLPAVPIPKATHLVLSLGQKKVVVFAEDRVLDEFPVAVGAPDTPTPTGEFEIFQMVMDPIWESPWTGEVHPPGPDSALGLRWIGFATQDNGIIGFHGTPTVSSIGQAVSNGCVRLRNEDVLALFDHARMGMRVIVDP